MFKKQNQIWWLLVGAIVMFVIFGFYVRNFLFPYITFRANPFERIDYQFSQPPIITISQDRNYQAYFYTNKGLFVVELFPSKAPINVNNFIFLSRQNYYNGTKFHRVFKDMLIQGGDRNTLNKDISDDGKGNAGYKLNDEINWQSLNFSEAKQDELNALGYRSTPNLESLPLVPGALAMASSGPNTNSSQFFIITAQANDPRLDTMAGKFTVIGQVISGASVVNQIANVRVNNANPNIPRPRSSVIIERVEIL